MRFLIDENLPFGIVEFLTSLGHDVLDIATSRLRGSSDRVLWNSAAEERRVIVTRDLDYPIVGLKPAPFALMLLRLPADFKADQITRIFAESFRKIILKDIRNRVVVISPGMIRISPLP